MTTGQLPFDQLDSVVGRSRDPRVHALLKLQRQFGAVALAVVTVPARANPTTGRQVRRSRSCPGVAQTP